MDLGLTDRHALVLGASSGLGLAVAQALLAEGASVTLASRSRERLEAAIAGLPEADRPRADLVAADLADPEAPARMAEAARARTGRVDVLVNNTGGPPPGLPSAVSPALVAEQHARMVTPVLALTLELLAPMRAQGWGRILTIASSGVVQPIPHLPVSNALRASLAGFMKTLAGEVAGDGVTVNLVAPGRIAIARTATLDAAAAQRSGRPVEEEARTSASAIPLGRYGTPEEFAAVVAFLAGTGAAYVTGSIVRVDGGAIRSVGG